MDEEQAEVLKALVLQNIATIKAEVAKLEADRDYWKGLAMQFHDEVHAEIERRAKVEI